MSDDLVNFAFDDATGIARLTFNRPKVLNAINIEMAQAFGAAVARLTGITGLRCVLVSGAGKAFMAGGDVASFADPATSAATIRALLGAINPALVSLRELDAPVIAAVHGVVAGGGLSVALAADIVLAADDTRFLLAYDRIGAIPDCGGTWHLPRRIGTGRAARMMMLSVELRAPEALDWGLVDRLAPSDGFAEAAATLAAQLARGPSRAMGAYRRLVDAAFTTPFASHLENECSAFVALTATDDFREATTAFIEKRAPHFSGK